MNCPLCGNTEYLTIRKSCINDLRAQWVQSFQFDPFPNEFRPKKIERRRCASCDLEFFSPSLFGDADFYSKLSKNSWYYEGDKWEYDVALEAIVLHKPSTLLEIGCGEGYFLEKIQSLGIKSIGVDINQDAIRECRQKGLHVDARSIAQIDESYDMVVLFEVLEHMEDLGELFNILSKKIVKKGGYLVVAVPNPEGYLSNFENNLLDMPPHHNSIWRLSCFRKLDKLFGFSVIDYQREPIRLVHFNAYLRNLSDGQITLSTKSFKSKIFYCLQKIIMQLISPAVFLICKDQVAGQTHLIVMRNHGQN